MDNAGITQPPPDTLPMTEERLREIEDLAAKAAPGPWTAQTRDGKRCALQVRTADGSHIFTFTDADGTLGKDEICRETWLLQRYQHRVANCAFVSAAREDVPALLREIRRLQQIVGRMFTTEDGLPITPGMSIWRISQSGHINEHIVTSIYCAEGGGLGWKDSGGHHFGKVFSTRAAALAASSAGESTGEGHERE